MRNNMMKDYGFIHSFVKSLKTATNDLNTLSIEDYAVLSGFALRINVHKDLCPSAMSVFDWNLLQRGAENIGFEVEVISRLWHEEQLEVERREKAYHVIENSLNKDRPVIVWDLSVPEWEVITESNDTHYKGISITGQDVQLIKEKLGRREIPILHIMSIKNWTPVNEEESYKKILNVIINHNEENESLPDSDYKEGYKAYDLWINKMSEIKEDDWESRYYLETYGAMRKLADTFFKNLARTHSKWHKISFLYSELADTYQNMINLRNNIEYPNNIPLIQNLLKNAKAHEKAIYKEAKLIVQTI